MRISKISDQDCPICAEMATFDAGLAAEFGWEFGVINYDFIREYPGVLEYVRRELVAPDGTVDIPIYAVEGDDGRIVGAVQGANTKGELRRKFIQAAGA